MSAAVPDASSPFIRHYLSRLDRQQPATRALALHGNDRRAYRQRNSRATFSGSARSFLEACRSHGKIRAMESRHALAEYRRSKHRGLEEMMTA